MSEKMKTEELRRIAREAVQLYKKGQLSEEELRDIVAYAISLEMSDFMEQSMSRMEQSITSILERGSESIFASRAEGAG
ncbi:MAG: hypothetical protein OXG07_02785 [Anaerolineaceae bacterium]|nr:hypothetical protein [Anaerolineaceae bacterium]MCY3907205.1 hypothetical protein [Anaerolineaceae bacterium]